MSEGLTTKQRLFVEAYLDCLNASEAARRAGYSERTAHAIGWENLRKPEIAEAVQAGFAERAMSADEVLSRLADHARATADDFLTIVEEVVTGGNGEPQFDDNGNPVVRRYPVLDLPKAHDRGRLHLVKKFSYTNNGPAIELYDAQVALALLGKHHMLFNDTTLNIDLSSLSDEQIARIAAGESLATVLRTKKDAAPTPG
jgi:phage terminase small subunit